MKSSVCLYRIVFWSLLGLFTSSVFAAPKEAGQGAAIFVVPEAFDVLSVDGEPYKKNWIRSGTLRQPLADRAMHEVIVLYKQIFEDGDDFFIVKSEPLMLRFRHKGAGDYVLSFDEPDEVEQAQAYAKNPVLSIMYADAPLALDIRTRLKHKSWLASFVGSSSGVKAGDFDAPKASGKTEEEEASNRVALGSATAASAQASAVAPEEAEQVLPMLNYWWSKATPQQRQAFLKSALQ